MKLVFFDLPRFRIMPHNNTAVSHHVSRNPIFVLIMLLILYTNFTTPLFYMKSKGIFVECKHDHSLLN